MCPAKGIHPVAVLLACVAAALVGFLSHRNSQLSAFYPDLRMAATRAAIRSTPVEDLYIVSSESLEDGRVAFRILVNPLVWWMWLAGPLLLLGTLVALWPQRSLAGSPVSTGRAGGNIAAAPFGPD